MALDFQGLKDDLLVAFTLGEEINPDSEQLLLDQMEAIARAIETYIQSGVVKSTILSLSINTAGAATAQKGPPEAVEISGKIE